VSIATLRGSLSFAAEVCRCHVPSGAMPTSRGSKSSRSSDAVMKLPEMIEIGVDVVQLDQPRLMGHRHLSDSFGGAICFWNTVDIQWSTSEAATESGIRAEVKEMMQAFNRFNGGIIARHYPQPGDIALPPEFHSASYQAFLENGCGLPA